MSDPAIELKVEQTDDLSIKNNLPVEQTGEIKEENVLKVEQTSDIEHEKNLPDEQTDNDIKHEKDLPDKQTDTSVKQEDDLKDEQQADDVPVEKSGTLLVAKTDEPVQENGEKSEELDVFGYTKTDEFTSEIYKIEVQNLPRYQTPSELKRLIKTKFNLDAKKVKVIKATGNRPTYGFVTFCNDEDRDLAIQSLNNYQLKKHTLKATKAKPSKDPALEKKKNQTGASDEPAM